MSAYCVVRLWCNHHACYKEFAPDPDLGWISQVSVMRKEAAKAGWSYVRHPRVRALDKDYCPGHKPETPAGETP
jgi:hypothetical protein